MVEHITVREAVQQC